MRRFATAGVALVAAGLAAAAVVFAQRVQPCAVYSVAMPPPEGVSGPIFVGQIPGACNGEEVNYRATIDFGDGSPPQIDVVPEPLGGGLGSRHLYRRAGTYPVVATVVDRRTGAMQTLGTAVTIGPPPG